MSEPTLGQIGLMVVLVVLVFFIWRVLVVVEARLAAQIELVRDRVHKNANYVQGEITLRVAAIDARCAKLEGRLNGKSPP